MTCSPEPPSRRLDERDVFISYTTRDEEVELAADLAEQLNTALRAQGIGATIRQRIWWDKDQIGRFEGSSGRLAQVLRSGIVQARCMVSVQTATYRSAPWCRFECETAKAFGVSSIDAARDDFVSPSDLQSLLERIQAAIEQSGTPDSLGFRSIDLRPSIPVSPDEALIACAIGASYAADGETRTFWSDGLQRAKIKGWRRPRVEFRDFGPAHHGYQLIEASRLISLRDTERAAHRKNDPAFDGLCWTDRFFGQTSVTNIRALVPLKGGVLKKMRPHVEDML